MYAQVPVNTILDLLKSDIWCLLTRKHIYAYEKDYDILELLYSICRKAPRKKNQSPALHTFCQTPKTLLESQYVLKRDK